MNQVNFTVSRRPKQSALNQIYSLLFVQKCSMLPIRSFQCRYTSFNVEILDKLTGTVPYRLLFAKFKSINSVSNPNSDGIVPDRFLLPMNKRKEVRRIRVVHMIWYANDYIHQQDSLRLDKFQD